MDSEHLGVIVSAWLGAPVGIEDLTRLPGGASKDTWSFSARERDGGLRRLVLRADRAESLGLSMALEAALLRAASSAGVPVPPVVGVGGESEGAGAAFLIMEFVDGETIPRRILRDGQLGAARSVLAEQCGRILAAVHRIPPAAVPGLPAGDPLEQLRRHPGMAASAVEERNGNLIIGAEGIRAVLDWELAHLGEPLEDLGWLCVKAWRFGSKLPVGGFGTVEQLTAAYEGAGGGHVDAAALDWWTVFGTLRWGIICIAQTLAHVSGAVRSVELAAIGRRVCEVESDLMDLLPWTGIGDKARASDTSVAEPDVSAAAPADARDRPPHDVPSSVELLVAVREFLESDVLGATEGRVRFHTRVAANVVAMVGRELQFGPDQAVAHSLRLQQLGVSSESELAAAIASGALQDRLGEVSDVVRSTVADKLAVANPGYRSPPRAE